MANQVYQRTKTHSINKVSITNIDSGNEIDIRPIVDEISIFMDIDNIITSGYLTVTEKGNLITSLPMYGREVLKIAFSTNADDFSSAKDFNRTFFVYAVDSIQEFADRRTYIIRFTDCTAIINLGSRVCQKFTGKVEESIQKIGKIFNKDSNSIFSKNLGGVQPFSYNDLKSVTTRNAYNFVVPNWHPLRAIAHFTSFGVSSDANSGDYNDATDCLFFQNRDGEFIFTSYKKLFDQSEKKTLQRVIPNTSSYNKAIMESRYNIEEYNINTVFNTQAQQLGLCGATLYYEDARHIVYKDAKYVYTNIYNIAERYASGISGMKTPYRAFQYSTNSYYKTVFFNGAYSDADNMLINFILPKHSLGSGVRAHMTHFKLTATLTGSSDLDVGDKVYMNITSSDNVSTVEYMNTDWIVSKVCHKISFDSYKTYVECFTPFINRNTQDNFSGINPNDRSSLPTAENNQSSSFPTTAFNSADISANYTSVNNPVEINSKPFVKETTA